MRVAAMNMSSPVGMHHAFGMMRARVLVSACAFGRHLGVAILELALICMFQSFVRFYPLVADLRLAMLQLHLMHKLRTRRVLKSAMGGTLVVSELI